MKNNIKYFVSVISILIVFTVIYFVVPYNKINNTTFYLNYAFTLILFIYQIILFYLSLKDKLIKCKLYNYPLIKITLFSVLFSIIICLLMNILNAFINIPIWILIVLFLMNLLFLILGTNITSSAKEIIINNENSIKIKTQNFDDFKTKITLFYKSFNYEPLNESVKKLYDIVIYSDPVSNLKTKEVDEEINLLFNEIKNKSNDKNYEELKLDIDHLIELLNQRNLLCKLGK